MNPLLPRGRVQRHHAWAVLAEVLGAFRYRILTIIMRLISVPESSVSPYPVCSRGGGGGGRRFGTLGDDSDDDDDEPQNFFAGGERRYV